MLEREREKERMFMRLTVQHILTHVCSVCLHFISSRFSVPCVSWWRTYAARKHDEDEDVADGSLLYDRNTLPRSAPRPDVVRDE